MAAYLAQIGDGKTVHLAIYDEGLRPICGSRQYEDRVVQSRRSNDAGRYPSRGVCLKCKAALRSLDTVARLGQFLSNEGKL